MKFWIRLLSCVLMMVLLSLMFGCSKELNKETQQLYIRVNDEYLSKEYISYFFHIAENEMLAEAGYASENATEEDIDTYWNTAEIDGKNAVDVARDLAVNNAVQQKLQYHKALEENITLSDDEKAQIEEMLHTASEAKGGYEPFEVVLSEAGTNIESYKQIMTENQYIQKLFDKYNSEQRLEISEEELISIKAEFGESGTDEEYIDYLKKQKFNSLADNWKKEAIIEIDDDKMQEITIH